LPDSSTNVDNVKRKLRSLKKLEVKIRFGDSFQEGNLYAKPPKMLLVWDEYFDINSANRGKAKYSLEDIASMDKDEFKDIVDEFFFRVYYMYYIENGIANFTFYNPEILKWMDLPYNSGIEEIKKKFRQLAKRYHPDTGGSSSEFIELMEKYRKLIE